VRDAADLRDLLARIDGRGYRAYKDLLGSYQLGDCELHVDHVQGDPFAAPSKLRLRVPAAVAGFDAALSDGSIRRVALEDFLAREARGVLAPARRGGRGSGKSGLIAIDAGGQEVLERTAVVIDPDFVEARLSVGLPAAGRRVLGREAERLLLGDLPDLAGRALDAGALDPERMQGFVEAIEDQEHLRAQLEGAGLVGFLADGSVLPRESGASDRPLRDGAVLLEAPPELRRELGLPRRAGAAARTLTGLGIPEGVTLIVGGGYHGKSTLLRALERCVYPHVPGDGRERVVCRNDAVKIRAEDGRRVEQCDISAFIDGLPHGRSTTAFCSEDASGSTSQAANIVEALEAGAGVLLLDEDTSATNFMVRDARMQALIAKDHEPITPFVERVRELWEGHGVSSVLVMGGCGDYLDVADTVIEMRNFLPRNVTDAARRVAAQQPSARRREAAGPVHRAAARAPLPESLDPSHGRRDVKIDARSAHELGYGRETIDLRALEQLVDRSQTRATGFALELARRSFFDGETTLAEVLDALEQRIEQAGLDVLDPGHARGPRHPGDFARPRRFEIAAALARLRTLRMRQR
jgi:predicted ABC-class ATPase